MDDLVHAAHGSVFDTIITSTFAKSKVLFPPVPLLKAFDQKVSPMFQRILGNTEEIQTLASVRDALLPKLVSGELRVKDPESKALAVGD
jgi:type I restriction enzyme S subunit